MKVLTWNLNNRKQLRHVGVLAGRNAHRILWPEILAWVGPCYSCKSLGIR